MRDYFLVIAQGIPTSLSLMAVSLIIAFVLAIIFTFVLSNGKQNLERICERLFDVIHRHPAFGAILPDL